MYKLILMPVIYSISDPRNNNIIYVGKTLSQLSIRLKGHITNTKSPLINIITEIISGGLIPKIEPLEIYDSDVANECEMFWIRQVRAWGFNTYNKNIGKNKFHSRKFTKIHIGRPENREFIYLVDSPKSIKHILFPIYTRCAKCGKSFIFNFGNGIYNRIRVKCRSCSCSKREFTEERRQLISKSKFKKVSISCQNEYIEFNSISDCAKFVGLHQSTISNCLAGRHIHKKYLFNYI